MASAASIVIDRSQLLLNNNTKNAILDDISEALRPALISNQQPKRHRSLLLALPAELRSAIYAAALFNNDNELAILRTCKQIYMEATPTLYQRPISFSSQAKLYSWVERSQEADLKRVRSLSLKLTDIDMSSLFDAGPSRRTPSATAWGLHQQELQNLDQALRALPGLQHLTIIPPEKNKSQLLRSMYLSFLDTIPARLPSLVQLTIHDEETLLQKVPHLKQLSGRVRLVFDSSKAPAEPASTKEHSDRSKTFGGGRTANEISIKTEDMETD